LGENLSTKDKDEKRDKTCVGKHTSIKETVSWCLISPADDGLASLYVFGKL
jgi:hypothetical protein